MALAHTVTGNALNDLDRFATTDSGDLTREEIEKRLDRLGDEMGDLHDLLFAARRTGLLIVLQGRDTSGKDGAIRCLLRYINAQSARVVPFKAPDERELAQDFLWRVHAETPGKGSIAIFNRSHYEDVIAVRVKRLAPESTWRPRFDHINRFERLLMDEGTVIVKLFLHISHSEQERRLLDREKDPTKAWKLSVGDWQEREKWDDYTRAYEEVLSRCSPPDAPWHIIPADRKPFRNLAVVERIVETLRPYRESWMESLRELGKTRLEELRAYRSEKPSRHE